MKKNEWLVLAGLVVLGFILLQGGRLYSAAWNQQQFCGTAGTASYAECKAQNAVNFCKAQKDDAFFGRTCQYQQQNDDLGYATLGCSPSAVLCPDIVRQVSVCKDDRAGNYACVDAWASAPNSCSSGWGYGSRYQCPSTSVEQDVACKSAQYAQCDALYSSAYASFYASATPVPSLGIVTPAPTVQPSGAPGGLPTVPPVLVDGQVNGNAFSELQWVLIGVIVLGGGALLLRGKTW